MKSEKLFALMACGIFAVTAPSMAQTVVYGPVIYQGTGSRYFLLNTPSWEAAEAWAVAHGGHLTTISNGNENNWIRDTLLNYGGEPRKAYLGLSDSQTEGTFAWSDGQDYLFANWNWAGGEPDTASDSDYAVMFPDGRWYARSNTYQQFAIAEIDGPIRVPQEFSTIQEAIDVAADGSTILLGPGIYYERPVIAHQSLTIRGVEGAASTIIDAQNAGRAFYITGTFANDCVLERLTIRNGQADVGAGLMCYADNVVVRDCIFHGNLSSWTGGAIYLISGGGTITNCLIYDNESDFGAGIFVFNALTNTSITNCTIINSAEYQGQSIYSHYGRVKARNCILRCSGGTVGASEIAYCNTLNAVAGVGNNSADPLLGPGYRLTANSPCIDAGTNALYPLPGFGAPLDCGGKGRFVDDPYSPNSGNGPGAIIDIGAMEYQPLPMTIGDMNGDGAVNGLDVAPFVAMLLL